MLTRNGNKLRLKRLWGGHARFNSEEEHLWNKSHKDCYCFAWCPGLESTSQYCFLFYLAEIWPNCDGIVQPSTWCRPFVLIITIRRSTSSSSAVQLFTWFWFCDVCFGAEYASWYGCVTFFYLCESHVRGKKKQRWHTNTMRARSMLMIPRIRFGFDAQ